MKKVKEITIEELDPGYMLDKDGYHIDYELKELKHDGNGKYEVTIVDLGRSDKTPTP